MPQIISKKTVYTLRDQLSDWSILRQIDVFFGSADIALDDSYEPPVPGQRRSLIEKYYRTLDLSNVEDARKLLMVFEQALSYLEARGSDPSSFDGERHQAYFDSLLAALKEDGFTYQNGRVFSVGHSSIPHLESIALAADVPHLLKQLERIQHAADADPWLVIGTAKELVETTCKTILTERGKSFDKDWDLNRVCKEARQALQLTPDNIPDTAKAAETIKRLLGNLASVVQGLAELRNPYGTGHGPEGRARGLELRHANLAAGAASTLAIFLWQTHQTR